MNMYELYSVATVRTDHSVDSGASPRTAGPLNQGAAGRYRQVECLPLNAVNASAGQHSRPTLGRRHRQRSDYRQTPGATGDSQLGTFYGGALPDGYRPGNLIQEHKGPQALTTAITAHCTVSSGARPSLTNILYGANDWMVQQSHRRAVG